MVVGTIAVFILVILVIAACCSSDNDSSNTNNTSTRTSSTKRSPPPPRNTYYNPAYCECPSCGAPYYDGFCEECGYPDVNQGWLGEEYG